MAYTLVSKAISLNGGNWTSYGEDSPYFFPEDIDIVKNQPGVVALLCCNAKFPTKGNSLCLVGLVRNETMALRKLDGPSDKIALPCQPFNVQGGIFFENT